MPINQQNLICIYCAIILLLFTERVNSQTASEVSVLDTRYTPTTPDSYYRIFQTHFKHYSSVGLPIAGSGFASVLALRGWNDNTGGKAHELAFTDDNQLRIRSGFSASWETWRRIVSEDINGHVGIGTIMPTSPLTVLGTNTVESPSIPRVLAVGDLTAPTKTISLGYDANLDAGVLASVHAGTAWKNTLINPNGGNVGIGTTNPGSKLDVNGIIRTFNKDNVFAHWDNLTMWSDGSHSFIQSNGDEDGLFLKSNLGGKIIFESNVGIGTATLGAYKLAVNGDAIFTKVKVKAAGGTWPDYVFHSSYKLPSLQEVEKFIKRYKHLPGVASADEVEEKGLDVGDNQATLLKKIEELTLYVIEQNKKMLELEKEVKQLKKKVN